MQAHRQQTLARAVEAQDAAIPANRPAARRRIDHQLGAQPPPVLLAMPQSKWHGDCCDCPGTTEKFGGDEGREFSRRLLVFLASSTPGQPARSDVVAVWSSAPAPPKR